MTGMLVLIRMTTSPWLATAGPVLFVVVCVCVTFVTTLRVDMRLSEQTGNGIKFARWQHPAVGRGASIAVVNVSLRSGDN